MTVMLPGKGTFVSKRKFAFAATSMLWTSFQEEIALLLTYLPVTVSLPSESVQSSPFSAISMAFASGGVSVTRICGRETPSASA